MVFNLLHNSCSVVGFLVVLSISGTPFLFLRFGFLARVGLVGLGLVSWLVFIFCFLRVGFRGLVGCNQFGWRFI